MSRVGVMERREALRCQSRIFFAGIELRGSLRLDDNITHCRGRGTASDCSEEPVGKKRHSREAQRDFCFESHQKATMY